VKDQTLLTFTYRFQWISVANGSIYSKGVSSLGSNANHYIQYGLARFFIRALRNERFASGNLQRSEVIVDEVVSGDTELAVFLRLLARSATGQPITTYTSHFHGPRPGAELHIVIVDHGRSRLLASDAHRASLRCIRCAACMNTCPVYRRSGGHSYGATVPGPIGSILAPSVDAKRHASLPFASTLCGSCSDVCPVRIDLHGQLLAWRGELAAQGLIPLGKRAAAKVSGWVLGRLWAYRILGKLARWLLPKLPRSLVYSRLNRWGRQRELPELPAQSFREIWRQRGEP